MDVSGAVAGAIHYGYYHILTQRATSLSIEETLEGDVFGVSCTSVLLYRSVP